MIIAKTNLRKPFLSVLTLLMCIGKGLTQAVPTECDINSLLGTTVEIVAFARCWKVEFFEGGGVYEDDSESTDCTNNQFRKDPLSKYSSSRSTGNLAAYDSSGLNFGFDGEIRLFEDLLQSDDIKAELTKWDPKSKIFGSYALTLTFQSCPSQSPSSSPSSFPSHTETPSSMPSSSPSQSPSGIPSSPPSSLPSGSPSTIPSSTPSSSPSQSPSGIPSPSPSSIPSSSPSTIPSSIPSSSPSQSPSKNPSSPPSSSSLPSSNPSTSPSRNPSSAPSNSPSNDPSINPSPLPSNVPSKLPSDTPSSKPSETPSEKPSSAPSSNPSSLPSVSPTSTCPISEFTGRTFVIPLSIGCFKLEIFDGGHIYADFNGKDCSNPQFDTSKKLSDYDGTADGNKATFAANGEADKWSGVLFVVQGDVDSTEISSLDVPNRQFQLLLKTTKCVAAPSMTPSILPTSVPSNSSIPSKFPTRQPSSTPSSIPSLTPSVLPTNIHSSLPSLYPSVSPSSTCPYDGFLGRTFKLVVYNECWIFDLPNEMLKIDSTDSTCSKTTPVSTAYDLSQFEKGDSNKFLFKKIQDKENSTWEGHIQIVEDTEVTQESLTLTKLDLTTDEFAFMLKVPDCPSNAPSQIPSNIPSVTSSPSSSFNPSELPTTSGMPSSMPSNTPSSHPSSEPSSKPSESSQPTEKTYTPFASRTDLKLAVNEYCANPGGWKDTDKFETYGPIEDWVTTNIEEMWKLFEMKSTCNPNISQWDVSNVKNFYGMFAGASAFNQDISGWDTSSATNFLYMFNFASSFNQDLCSWKDNNNNALFGSFCTKARFCGNCTF